MSLRIRVLQSLILGLIGLSLILYTAPYSNYIQTNRIEPLPSNQEIKNDSSSTFTNNGLDAVKIKANSASVPSSSKVEPSLEKDNNKMPWGKSKVKAVMSIPKRASDAEHSDKGGGNGNVTGFLTKDVYVSGHVIPSLDSCPDLGKRLKLLVLVTSSPTHSESRMAIRQTWGHFNQRKDISVAFVCGLSKSDKVNDALQKEAALYGDVIQARFVDSYNNLTLKTVSMLEWADNYCSKAAYVLKTDDDMFINIPRLMLTLEKGKRKGAIYGKLAKRWKPIRNASSKYFVSRAQFSPAVFPDFTTGPAYVMTSDVVHPLYAAALESTFLKLEDVFITGVVAKKLGVKRVHVNEFLNKKVAFNVCNVRNNISIHMVKFYEQYVLWEKLHNVRVKCKSKTLS